VRTPVQIRAPRLSFSPEGTTAGAVRAGVRCPRPATPTRVTTKKIERWRAGCGANVVRCIASLTRFTHGAPGNGRLTADGDAAVDLARGGDGAARPGTTLNPTTDFSYGWEPGLRQPGHPYCTIDLPGNAMADIQTAGEYVVVCDPNDARRLRRTHRHHRTLAGRNGAPLGAALLGYTDVYTLTDEVVVPNFGPAGLLRHRKLP
jgi:hypothetical protein